jgi:asparagine synthase (glutamine-hydrolysing)
MEKNIVSRFDSSEQKVGVLLSGGFDSCIILTILVKHLVSNGHDFKQFPLNVFSFGAFDNSDIRLAQEHVLNLEDHYKIDIHHHIISLNDISLITQDIPDIIETLETFDVTTIRKTLPLVYLLKYIQTKTDIKVLLTGDGLDELGGGYSEFNELSDQKFQDNSVDLISNIGKFDLLRLDKIGGKYSVEFRYPFLNKEFVEYILSIHPRLRKAQVFRYAQIPIEKYIIRKAFDGNKQYVIDDSILWNYRQDINDAFDKLNKQLEEYCNNLYTDVYLSNYISLENVQLHPILPNTKEELYYIELYDKFYPKTKYLFNMSWTQQWKL